MKRRGLPSTVRYMPDAQAAWVGAMVEGEGTIEIGKRAVRVSVINTDVEIISALLRFVGDGYVRLQSLGVNRPVWVWSLGRFESLCALSPQIAPYMSHKGDRLLAALAAKVYAV